jgi:hypothetical protein
VTQVFDILSQVSEEEYIVLSDLASDLNLLATLVNNSGHISKGEKVQAVKPEVTAAMPKM